MTDATLIFKLPNGENTNGAPIFLKTDISLAKSRLEVIEATTITVLYPKPWRLDAFKDATIEAWVDFYLDALALRNQFPKRVIFKPFEQQQPDQDNDDFETVLIWMLEHQHPIACDLLERLELIAELTAGRPWVRAGYERPTEGLLKAVGSMMVQAKRYPLLESHCESLAKEKERELREQASAHEKSLGELERNHADTLADVERRINLLFEERGLLEDQLLDLQNRFHETINIKKEQEVVIEQMERQNANLSTILAETNERYDQAVSELSKLHQSLLEEKERADESTRQTSRITMQLREAQIAITDFTHRYTMLQNEQQFLITQLAHDQQQLSAVTLINEDLKQEVKEHEQHKSEILDELKAETNSSTQANIALQDRIAFEDILKKEIDTLSEQLRYSQAIVLEQKNETETMTDELRKAINTMQWASNLLFLNLGDRQ